MKGAVKETAAVKRITCVDQGGLCFSPCKRGGRCAKRKKAKIGALLFPRWDLKKKKKKNKKTWRCTYKLLRRAKKKTKIMSHLNSRHVKQFQFLNEQKAGAGLLSPMRMQLFDLEANANSKNFTHLWLICAIQMRWVTAPYRTIIGTVLLLTIVAAVVTASQESRSNRRNGAKGKRRNRSTTTTPSAFEFQNETASSFSDGDDEDDVEAAVQHQQDQPPGGIETCEVARLKCAYRVGCGMALQVWDFNISSTFFDFSLCFGMARKRERERERQTVFVILTMWVMGLKREDNNKNNKKTIAESRCDAVEQC